MTTEVSNIEELKSAIADNAAVVVDCWSPTCGPCKAFLPIFEKLSTQVEDVVFVKVNVAEVKEAIAEFGLRAVPTIMLFKNGEMAKNKTGMMTEEAFYKFLTE